MRHYTRPAQLGEVKAVCGAQVREITELSMQWADVECLHCVAQHHPLPTTRERAWAKLADQLPPLGDLAALDAWLG